MAKRMVAWVVLAGVTSLAACSSLRAYPSEWHRSASTVRVYVYGPSTMVELPVVGPLTVLDAVLASKLEGDLSRVVVFRSKSEGAMRWNVNVLEMFKTGDTSNNIQLQPGDVVGIAG